MENMLGARLDFLNVYSNLLFNIGKVSVSSDGAHWIIPNFYNLPQVHDTVIRSPDFDFQYKNWNMLIYPNGLHILSSTGWFGVSAVHEIRGSRVFIVRLGIIGDSEEEKWIARAEHDGDSAYRCTKLMTRSRFDSLRIKTVPRGNLHLFFTTENENGEDVHSLTYNKEEGGNVELKQKHIAAYIEASTQTKEEIGFEKLRKDFGDILLKGNLSDVVLKVDGQEFKAHRCVLGARSPVFLAMMTHETKEKISGVADIPDIEPSIFSEFLKYLYTGRVENFTLENVVKLYTAADKYQVNELKEICMDHMKTNVSSENFCDVFMLSLRHDEKDLKDICIEFFTKNSLDIVLTVGWQTFLSENPMIGNELFIKHLQLNKGR